MSGRPQRSARPIRRILHEVERSLLGELGRGGGRWLIVGLSGGADSSALLFCLADLQQRSGWRPRAVHVDHGIASAAVRSSFRAAAAAAAQIADAPFEVQAVDALAEQQRGGGLEAAARRVRYAALAARARACGAPALATAHTLNDQAETVLMRLIRGAGIDGLAGIPALGPAPQGGPGLRVVRPLLGISRAQTLALCRAWDFAPVEDPSNADRSRLRNQLRAEVLPLLRRSNPRVDAALARLAQQARTERSALEAAAAAAAQQLSTADGAWRRAELLAIAAPLRPRVLRRLAARCGLQLSAERTAAALALIERGRGRVELGGGWACSAARGTVWLERQVGPE